MAAAVLLWVAIHRVPWLGPALAEAARSVVGPGPVAWVEDRAYGLQDRVDRWRYRDAPPREYWTAPTEAASAPPLPASADAPAATPSPSAGFFPEPFEPPYPEVAAAADGIWVPVPDLERRSAPVVIYKTMVHPDRRRSFAVLAVMALDLAAFELHLAAGTHEPTSYRVLRKDRTGLVRPEHIDELVAAFNGGFRASHGEYGMMLEGIEYLPPRGIACTLARYRSGALRIGTWTELAASRQGMLYYRQTPPCLVEQGVTHLRLERDEYAKGWGATVSGDTVIRRSAIGLDREGQVLYYGLGDGLTAQAIARGMKAAGAHSAALLDVNYSYPRFLLYRQPAPGAVPLAVSAIIPTLEYQRDEYVVRPSRRDFFYLTRGGSKSATSPEGAGASTYAANGAR
ncbi:MAG: phosphodiester glycosidase family protein [Deltaproteobacteria bacterium]|nr:phosphodiester glycosidase family protein [Deltaproteobacteria bacterium]MBW2534996.1 phosphodiester glycosidase family protein [Deltaproteobacteria bacterium]